MSTLRNAAILLGLSAGVALASSPANAGPATPTTACPTTATSLTTFLASGFECTVGDKNFSNFTYNISNPAMGPTAAGINTSVTTTASGNFYTVLFQANSPGSWMGSTASPTTGTLGFTVTVNSLSTDLITSITGAVNSSIPGSTYTWNTTSSGSVAPPATCQGTESINSCTGIGSNPPPLSLPGVTSTVVSTSFTTGTDGVQSVQNTIIQSPVPGPLPILGAGAAFGFSRKLRTRIKSVA